MLELRTQQELIDFFGTIKQPLRAHVVTRTPVKMNKKDVATKTIANTVGEVFKVQTIEVELNADYESTVNMQRMVEGTTPDFKSEKLKWGRHINGSIIDHEGQLYLKTVEIGKVGHATYERESGSKIEYSDFAAFVPNYGGSPKQELTEEVKVRTFKMSNVIGVNINGKVRYVA